MTAHDHDHADTIGHAVVQTIGAPQWTTHRVGRLIATTGADHYLEAISLAWTRRGRGAWAVVAPLHGCPECDTRTIAGEGL